MWNFKDFVGGFRWNKNSSGIEYKNDKKVVVRKGASVGNIFFGDEGDKLIAQREKNLDIISDAKVEDNYMKSIQNVDHVKMIKDFVEKGANGSIETAKFVRDLIPKFIVEKEYRKRKDIELALEFLNESSTKERGILLWTYILLIIGISNNVLIIQKKLKDIRKLFPLTKLINYNEVSIFGRYGAKPDMNVNNISLTKKFNSNKVINDNFTKEEFFEIFYEFKNLNDEIYDSVRVNYIAPYINPSLTIAAEVLLNEATGKNI